MRAVRREVGRGEKKEKKRKRGGDGTLAWKGETQVEEEIIKWMAQTDNMSITGCQGHGE